MAVQQSQILTHTGVMTMMQAAVAEAERMGQPQCIVIVDASGVTLAQLRMTGAKYLSLKSAESKARTSASIRAPSGAIPQEVAASIAAATAGQVTGLGGGLAILMQGECLGGIGVGSGSVDQDLQVARAALSAVGADLG